MDDTIHYLPLLCKQLLRQGICRTQVPRWLRRARQDWGHSLELQRIRHAAWSQQPLSRPDLLVMRQALELAREHQECVEHALNHLQRFANSGQMPEVSRASARWSRAERARDKYLRHRAELERTALEWRSEKAA